jgi:hypothetical protein
LFYGEVHFKQFVGEFGCEDAEEGEGVENALELEDYVAVRLAVGFEVG